MDGWRNILCFNLHWNMHSHLYVQICIYWMHIVMSAATSLIVLLTLKQHWTLGELVGLFLRSLSCVSTAMLTYSIDIAILSVCLAHCSTVSKWLNISSYFLQRMVAQHSSFFTTEHICKIPTSHCLLEHRIQMRPINFAVLDRYLAKCGKWYKIGP